MGRKKNMPIVAMAPNSIQILISGNCEPVICMVKVAWQLRLN